MCKKINDRRMFRFCNFAKTFVRASSVSRSSDITLFAEDWGFSSPRLMRAALLRSSIVTMFWRCNVSICFILRGCSFLLHYINHVVNGMSIARIFLNATDLSPKPTDPRYWWDRVVGANSADLYFDKNSCIVFTRLCVLRWLDCYFIVIL